MSGHKDLIVTMSTKDLDDMIYYAVLRASDRTNQNLYDGLIKGFFRQFERDMETVLSELDYIKSHLQTTSNETPEKSEIDYKKIAAEVSEEMKDAFGAVIDNVNENTNDQIARVLGE